MQIDPIISKLKKDSISIKNFSEKFRKENRFLKAKVLNKKIKICGVDGGFVSKQISSSALIVRRAIATCFEYEGLILKNSKYLPAKYIEPEIIFETVEHEVFSIFSNLKRVELEITTAIKAINKFNPDVLILDGSIVIHPSSIPDRTSKYYPLFLEISKTIRELYNQCSNNNVQLIGAVEDSFGRRFIDNDFMNDSNVLYHVLSEGEYIKPKKYSDNLDLPSLTELGKFSAKVNTTYLKIGKYDSPLRIDFFGDDVENVTNMIYTYSRITQDYSYPTVLIEADARSKLTNSELKIVYDTIKDKLGINPLIFELRRNKRAI